MQRIAVLYALQRPYNTADQIRDGTKRLLGQWRARVDLLLENGWTPLQSANSVHSSLVLGNCLPAFVMVNSPARTCRRAMFCPFCYARRVKDMWQLVDRFCQKSLSEPSSSMDDPEEEQETAIAAPRTKLVFRQHSGVVLMRDDCPDWRVAVASLFRSSCVFRKELVSAVRPAGAIATIDAEPYGDRGVRLLYRQVFALPVSAEFPAEIVDRTDGYVTELPIATRREAYRETGRLFQYPAGLLSGDPYMTALILNAAMDCKVKCVARYGSFRRGMSDVVFED